jgi:hypothetical protein
MSTNDPKSEHQPIDPARDQPETLPPISYDAAASGGAEADAARATGTEEGEQLADAIDRRMYVGGSPAASGDAGTVPGDPFRESDEAAAPHPPDVPPPAGTVETVYDESPETPATVPPATTGTGSSIAIGCIAAAVVIVLIAVLVLTIVS